MKPGDETKPCIAIACGGTGGHLFPGLAVGSQLLNLGCDVSLLVSPKDVDQQAVKSARGMQVFTLPAVALQNGNRLAFLRGFWNSLRASRKLFKQRRPDAVLAMGGFTSAPPVLAARLLGAKAFLHESNTIPGRANRWLAHFIKCGFVGFEQAGALLGAKRVSVTGTPVRSEFQTRDSAACCQALGLDPMKPVLLVIGGSQGASGINELIVAALPLLVQRGLNWQWVHLTGPKDVTKVAAVYDKLGVRAIVQPFMENLAVAMGAATACVSRAGASSLAEIAAMRLPSLLVPFPHAADNHQFHNAHAFANSGAARFLEQKEAQPEIVATLVLDLVENNGARSSIQSALAQWHAPDAAREIAGTMLRVIMEGNSAIESGEEKSSKLQAPSSRESSSTKHQAVLRGGLGIWMFWVFGCFTSA